MSIPTLPNVSALIGVDRILGEAFQSGSPAFVSDSGDLVEHLRSVGIEAYRYDEVPSTPKSRLTDVVAIPVSFDTTPSGEFINKYFSNSAMLVLPIASFCGSDEGAVYMLSMLATTDIRRCVEGVSEILGHIETEETLRFVGGGTDVTVQLGDEVCLMAPKTTPLIARGEWVSVAQYLEVGLINTPGVERPSHVMNGIFVAEGHVVAHHRMYRKQVEATARLTWRYLNDLTARQGGAPLILTIKDSRPMDLTCGSESILDEVRTMIDPDNRDWVTEFGMAATSQWPAGLLDWGINSQINEAIGGLHLGLGRGATGSHIDLVAPRAVAVHGYA